jgi:indole-3-glycerol phosphate synthase
MDILHEIAEKTRIRIEREKSILPFDELKRMVREGEGSERAYRKDHVFLDALKKPGMSYICEVKKASPSKGLIAKDFPYLDIATEYEAAGASAISCLTEPDYFMGSNEYLSAISEKVEIPVLKKDFTIDEYMIYQAAYYKASAVLLICALLDDAALKGYRELAESLDMDALVETHDEAEAERALKSGARIVGVNNRDLRTFKVDTNTSIRLRKLVPKEVAFVSESGISSAEDIRKLRENGTDAVLIGETLMRSADKAKALAKLNGGELKLEHI